MGRYRKKPVVIEAIRNEGSWQPICDWLVARAGGGFAFEPGATPEITRCENGSLEIHTLEGVMVAGVGDWVIQGIQGEFYPCKPDIFEQTYESIEEPTP